MAAPPFYLRINGIAHAFSRQLGCDCGRCRTINYNMTVPPNTLSSFSGWQDPPWRAQTSVSILIPDAQNPQKIAKHILIDVGYGVVESLAASRIPGIENVTAMLLTHWHPDHVIGANLLGESVKRANKTLSPIPLYCHVDTYSDLKSKFEYDMMHFYDHRSVSQGTPFEIESFIERNTDMKIIFAWDIDTPDSKAPNSDKANIDLFKSDIFQDADLMILESNTWQTSAYTKNGEIRKTGHTSFVEGWRYVEACRPKTLAITHMSGHEDVSADDKMGLGWPDRVWIDHAQKYADLHPVGGRKMYVYALLQGTVISSGEILDSITEKGREVNYFDH